MTLIICAVKDKTVTAFMPPFTARNTREAERMFMTTVNQKGHVFNVHPKDFSLYALGEFDETTGDIEKYTEPEYINSADVLREEQPEQGALFSVNQQSLNRETN